MKKLGLTFWIIFITIVSVYSQVSTEKPPSNWTKSLHIESGCLYPNGSIREEFSIRQNINSFYVDQNTNGEIFSDISGFVAGARWEYYNTKLKTGVSTGLRFISYRCEITGYSSYNSDFFFLRYSIEADNTKFARVTSITETTNLITLPVEFRVVPFTYRKFGLFIKAGAELSLFNMGNKTSIDFREDSMEEYEAEVIEDIGAVSKKFYSAAYWSVGIKFGHENKPNYMLEVFLPSFFLTKDNFQLADVSSFEGFKFSVLFPFRKSY